MASRLASRPDKPEHRGRTVEAHHAMIIEKAHRRDVDPFAYLVHVAEDFERAMKPAGHAHSRLIELGFL